jgi:hypothetical protein
MQGLNIFPINNWGDIKGSQPKKVIVTIMVEAGYNELLPEKVM